jgi:hypothetical protein
MQQRITERGFLSTILLCTVIYLFYDAMNAFLTVDEATPLTTEEKLQVLTVVLTNFCAIPSLISCITRELFTEAIIGGMSILTSIFYHTCQTTRFSIWSMNDGRWHRLDNVFVILCCQGLAYYLLFATSIDQTKMGDTMEPLEPHAARFMHEQRVLNMFRWLGLALCLVCQERAPWEVTFTIIPVVIPTVLALFRKYLFVPLEYRPRFNSQRILYATILFTFALFFFALGLDDDNDYLRIKHGMWHAFIGAAFYFFFRSKDAQNTNVQKHK